MNATDQKRGMVMRYPATRWHDALPVGSGVVGTMLYGNIEHDRLLLNHDALYRPGPRQMSISISDQLAEMRALIDAGKCREAAKLMRLINDQRWRRVVGIDGTDTRRGGGFSMRDNGG